MAQPMDGRRAQAARNDDRILASARAVFLADPGAPIAAVAADAGVGISALYRRYASKEDLLRELAHDALTRFKADLELALAERGDPWASYSNCLARVLDGQSQALAQRIAGTFKPTKELNELASATGELFEKLHRRAQRAKALRRDVTTADVILLLEMLSLVDIPEHGEELRRRYLALILGSLRFGSTDALPGPPATGEDLAARWRN
jgi:AcrR family transcriptional regulator